MIDQVKSATRRSKTTNTTRQVLVLWSRTVTLNCIQVELSLIRSSWNTSFIDLRWNDSALISLLLMQWSSHLVIHLNLWSTTDLAVAIGTLSLICLSQLCLLRRWLAASLSHIHLLAISTCLRPPLDLILYVLCLFFVWFSDWQSLANLELLWSIKRAEMWLLLLRLVTFASLKADFDTWRSRRSWCNPQNLRTTFWFLKPVGYTNFD